ncbi:MAG TPA: precorrin-2 C(20)-methyltransferase [Isosphaeraceae bacterium]|nr:precorrin-2 C(20)-methyltransferase [Isosphaeraceae bacterium]
MNQPETVHVIGVGPGDPELLTVRAARVLSQCDTILHPGPRAAAGFAIEVVAPLLRPEQAVRGMALVMQRGGADDSVGYERVALALIEEARAGRRAAFLTEGDPMLFGTGSYVVEYLKQLAPEVAVEVVPGVSAISAAAARLGWPLAQKQEILTICPATYHADDLGAILDRGGAVCWLKAADVLPRLIEELRKRDRLDRAALVERVGRPDERIFRDLTAALGEKLSYFSLVLVR